MYSLAVLFIASLCTFASAQWPASGSPTWTTSVAATSSAASSASATPCSAAVNGLIAGIEINILAQHGELNATLALQAIEAESPVDQTAFAAGQAVLVSNVLFGMTIREYNQMILPAGNAATAGLMKYAGAEETELELAQSLNGDPSHDSIILATLVSDVTTGIQLNKNNTLLAASGCSSPLLAELPIVVADVNFS